MATPFLGELKIISFNFAPKGWAFCNGQLLPINQNQALFSLFGTTYGGDGRTTFALPDMRGRVGVGPGQGITQGERAGEAAHTVSVSELAGHIHLAQVQPANASTGTPNNNFLAGAPSFAYRNNLSNLTNLIAGTIGNAGGSQAHDNTQPYLVLNVVVALTGIFPSQN